MNIDLLSDYLLIRLQELDSIEPAPGNELLKKLLWARKDELKQLAARFKIWPMNHART